MHLLPFPRLAPQLMAAMSRWRVLAVTGSTGRRAFRGGQVEELFLLPERQAGVIVYGQLSDLRIHPSRHSATSASPPPRVRHDRTGPKAPRARQKPPFKATASPAPATRPPQPHSAARRAGRSGRQATARQPTYSIKNSRRSSLARARSSTAVTAAIFPGPHTDLAPMGGVLLRRRSRRPLAAPCHRLDGWASAHRACVSPVWRVCSR